MNKKIENFLEKLPREKRDLVMQIRKIVLSTDKKITEDIKWGNLTFVYNGNLASIYTFTSTDYLNFCFFNATNLSDPMRLFEGTGKMMRHVKIKSANDINSNRIRSWIIEAMKLNE